MLSTFEIKFKGLWHRKNIAVELREMLTSVRNNQTREVCNTSSRRVLMKIMIRKLQQNDVSKMFFNSTDELMLIYEGTYVRHQKSSNNEYQRKSYSGQEKVPLCKPFTISATTGRALDMAGPFYANQNDDEITIVYYVPRRIMRVITRRATMLAGDQSRGKISPASILSESRNYPNFVHWRIFYFM